MEAAMQAKYLKLHCECSSFGGQQNWSTRWHCIFSSLFRSHEIVFNVYCLGIPKEPLKSGTKAITVFYPLRARKTHEKGEGGGGPLEE
jgi:hypothetical protein